MRALILLVLSAAVGVAVGVLAGHEPDRAAAVTSATGPPAVQRLLAQRLDAKHLTYRYVACIANGRRFQGTAVVRCNVNFNAPHIEVYCAVVRHGRLLTEHEHPGIPCPRDQAGEDPPVRTYTAKGSAT
jgi:hypothetical protein